MSNKRQYLNRQSIRTRVTWTIGLFSIVLVSFYTKTLAHLYTIGLSDATHSVVIHETNLYVEAYRQNNDTPLPRSQSLQGFIGVDNVPPSILFIFPPNHWSDWPQTGNNVLYKFQKNEGTETHHHLLITPLPNTHKNLFMFYSVTASDEAAYAIWNNYRKRAALGIFLVIIMLIIFQRFMARMLSPLSCLSHWIHNLKENSPPPELPKAIKNDEIGQVAKSLFSALTRAHHHNERERQFLRNASHELRTPIANISGAMDILEFRQNHNSQTSDPVLERIRRANQNMKSVTEAILWLATEKYATPPKKIVNFSKLVSKLIEDSQIFLNTKSVKILQQLDPNSSLLIEEELLHISCDNLIRNAFQHCSDGDIVISTTQDQELVIKNQRSRYSGHNEDNKNIQLGNFGLGLVLVKKIADRQGWKFTLNLENEWAEARLKLNNTATVT